LYLLLLAWTYRVRKARFRVTSDSQSETTVLTDVCRFTIQREQRVVVVDTDKSNRVVPFSDIHKLGFRFWSTPTAQLLTTDWYEISLVLRDGENVPLFVGGQTVRQKFQEGGWYAEAWLLSKVRLFRDVGDISRQALDEVLASFSRSGIQLSLV
jgi:hypothetical protein